MAYTGDTMIPEARRRRGIAIEPMTCPPNAFRSGIDVIPLGPGRPWTGTWGIAPQLSSEPGDARGPSDRVD
jgi:aldose 1-epimerase